MLGQPRTYNAVYDVTLVAAQYGAVWGDLGGVRKQINVSNQMVWVAALQKVLEYGEADHRARDTFVGLKKLPEVRSFTL